jgi:hypothetical protein
MMEYTLLEVAELGPEAQRALASPAVKMMAARGMAPLSNPIDLLSVLYQLCNDRDQNIGGSARESAKTLPQNILEGALADARLDPRVIDYFVFKADCKEALVEIVVLNQRTADETIARLASRANQKQVDLIATNEQRILRHPDIIAALYKNTKARMSTVDRVVELAVRHEMKVHGIPAWEEVSRAVLQQQKSEEPKLAPEVMDKIFGSAVMGGDDDEVPLDQEQAEISIRDMTIPMKIRLAMIGNKFQRSQLIRDPKKMVALAVIKSPSVKEMEAAKYASSNAICEDVIAYIAMRKDWTKIYSIKQSLVSNPKCPLPAAMRLLPHLRAKDIAGVARSRSIPSALTAQAKKLKAARSGGGSKS